jgi:hypothetical protein
MIARHWAQCVLSVLCIVLAGTAWIGFQNLIPLPAVAGLVDARIDKTRQNYSMILSMRDAGTHGHALVTWVGGQNASELQTFSFGYYARDIRSIIEVFDSDGTVSNELLRPINSEGQTRFSLVFWVDAAQWNETRALVDNWRGKGRYQLFQRDCVTFVTEIVSPLRLTVPSRLLYPTPRQFVSALLEFNSAKPDH